jgi:plasmid maintenance system killer protein
MAVYCEFNADSQRLGQDVPNYKLLLVRTHTCIDFCHIQIFVTEKFMKIRGLPANQYVSNNYRITFGWQKGIIDVDLEDYH